VSTGRDKLLAQFRGLVSERLGRVSRALMSLENGPDPDAGRLTLRELHGLKGEARMMGFAEVNSLVHEMEELVRVAEPRGFALTGGSVDALLVVSDAVSVLAGATQGEPPDVPRLLAWLSQAVEAEKALGGGEAPPAASAAPPSASAASGAQAAPQTGSHPAPTSGVHAAPPSATGAFAAPAGSRAEARPADSSIRITQQSLEVLTSATTNLQQRARQRELDAHRRRELARELVALHRLAEDLGPAGQGLAARLGRAKELAGELNRRATLANTDELKDLAVLAEEITALRMVPLSRLFETYPRMVRELGKDLGKDVELSVEGEDERVDRSVLEALQEPLLHLVRNAIDHGLEPRDVRLAQGKLPKGTIRLVARREGERLLLRVDDDGRGLHPEHLRQAAVRKGLLDAAAAQQLTDAQAIDLVFLAGFSSKDTATDVSGRGIGLDVVRTKLLAVGGEVTITSTPGRGASFELRVPISLTVAPVLFVQVGDDRLCLSAANVERALPVQAEQRREVAGRPALLVEGEVFPFSSVASLLFGAPERPASEGELVLVLRGRGQGAAVAVDRVLEERVQAILPLKGLLSRFAHLSGATPLADGALALVLSAPHLVAAAHGRELRLAALPTTRQEVRRRRVLVVDDSPLTRELLVQLLESVGYHIIQAVDGAQAMEVLAREAVDIVVTDLEMPNVDGLELTRRLKSHATFRSLPVVIVTTRGSETDRRRGMEAGADGYVTKGDLVRQDLVDVVARLLA
jgi:two-component system sensor histidine kinase and response regulator WspE